MTAYDLEIYYTFSPDNEPHQVFENLTDIQAEGALGAYFRDITMPGTGLREIRLVRKDGNAEDQQPG